MREKFFGVSGRILGAAAFMLTIAFCRLDAKAVITQTQTTNDSITITWNDSTRAGYYLGYSNIDDYGQAEAAAKNMALSKSKNLRYAKQYTISNVTPGKRYVVAIAYKDSTGKFNTTTSAVKTVPTTVSGLNQGKWYRELLSCRVSWNRQTTAEGYEYRFMDENGNIISQASTTNNSFFGKVANKKIYSVSVRAYNTIGGARYYSNWCAPTYLMSQPARKKGQFVNFDLDAKVSGGKMKISWEKVKGVDGYTVYAATKKNGAFTQVATVEGNKHSCKISRIDNKKLKKNKKYYVYVEAYKKAGGRVYKSSLNYITAVKGSKHEPLWVGIDWK